MRISDWSSDVCSSDLRAPLDFARDQMTDHFGIGLAGENPALRDQLIPQRLEILDDAIVDQRHVADDMWMRGVPGWCAMSGPAGMGTDDRAGKRLPPHLSRPFIVFPRSEERRQGQRGVGS